MRHDEARAPFHHTGEGSLYLLLGTRVDRGGRFVEDKHRRQAKHHAGDGEKLLLTLGQAAAILADDGVVALGQSADEAVCVGSPCGFDHFFIRRVRTSHFDIFTDRGGFQPRILQYHAVVFAEALSGDLPNILAVYRYDAPINVVKSHEKIDYGGFSASRRTDERDPLPRLNGEIEILDERTVGRVGERNSIRFEISLGIAENLRIGCIGRFRRRIDQLKEA